MSDATESRFGKCGNLIGPGSQCPCNHYEHQNGTDNICTCEHRRCFHETLPTEFRPAWRRASDASQEMRALYPAFGSTGGVMGSAIPSVRGRSGSRRGGYVRPSLNRPVNSSPVAMNSNITSVAATVTSGMSRPLALRNLPTNLPTTPSGGQLRSDDSDGEQESTTCVEVMVLGKIIGNTIPETNYSDYERMHRNGLIKTVIFKDHGDADDFKKTLEGQFPVLRGENWKMLQKLGQSRSKKLGDAPSEEKWTIKKLLGMQMKGLQRLFIAPATVALEIKIFTQQQGEGTNGVAAGQAPSPHATALLEEASVGVFHPVPSTSSEQARNPSAKRTISDVNGNHQHPTQPSENRIRPSNFIGHSLLPETRSLNEVQSSLSGLHENRASSDRPPAHQPILAPTRISIGQCPLTASTNAQSSKADVGNGQQGLVSEAAKIIVQVMEVDHEYEEAGEAFPLGFNSTGVELGRTLGRSYVTDEVADPNIVRQLKLFSGTRPQSNARPQWTLLKDQSISLQYLEKALTLTPQDLKFGVSMQFDGAVGPGVFKGTSSTFWKEVFEHSDEMGVKFWDICGEGKSAFFLPRTGNNDESERYFATVGRILVMCLTCYGSLPNQLHPAIFEYRFGPFSFNRNVMRDVNVIVANIMAYAILNFADKAAVSVSTIPALKWYCEERGVVLDNFRALSLAQFLDELAETELIIVRAGNMTALLQALEETGLAKFIESRELWGKPHPLFYRVVMNKNDFFSGFLDPEWAEMTEAEMNVMVWFKQYVNSASKEEIQQMTMFVTGTLRMPIDPEINVKFDIMDAFADNEAEGRLPHAATCMNTLHLCATYGLHEQEVFNQDLRRAFSLFEYYGHI